MSDSNIILDVDRKNFKICWMDKKHVLRHVGLSNDKIHVSFWKDFFLTMEKNYGPDTPEMWDEFQYKDDVMRCYISPDGDGFKLTLKELPVLIFGCKYKTFKKPTMFECFKAGYDYVNSIKKDVNDKERFNAVIMSLEKERDYWQGKFEQLSEEYASLEAKYNEALQFIDDLTEEECRKAANERLSDKAKDELEYLYDYATETFRQVTDFDEFDQPILAKRGFPFNAELGMKIINLYHRKDFKPQQIVNHLGLHGLNNNPRNTVERFLKAYNRGLLERAIMFCCNNPYNDVHMDAEELLKYPS